MSLNDIRAASTRFYDALNKMAAGDAAAMAEAWAQTDECSAQHPIGGRDLGYDTIVAGFAKVAEIAGGGQIRLSDQRIDLGTDLAVETGLETGTIVLGGHEAAIHQRVTNVYRRVNGTWKLAHHHTDLSEDMLSILKRLSEAA
ncbi:nuclear transport factor 2 family protein [Roseovarius nubinhibens]|uniref:nuclear transport factor 2 family protein n=1 Tax=Roseovarius nubinhibens TaxID=314263 RepID=UPI001C08F778|nr:nuclear transport factor 2 family protein [Roseovarius nubinhibens]MBU3000865.1 nuclear transport factor 2 family protein [Roseovarius nubinhibens]